MNENRKLLVLDVDNTLLHTVLLPDEDTNKIEMYRDLLLQKMPGSIPLKGEDRAIVVPRPHLSDFLEFLSSNKSRLDIGIYSTGSDLYLEKVLSAVFPWAIGNAQFIWGLSRCESMGDKLVKDLEAVASTKGYSLSNIRMVDDLDIVIPTSQRIPIKPFVVTDLEIVKEDDELLNVIKQIEFSLLND